MQAASCKLQASFLLQLPVDRKQNFEFHPWVIINSDLFVITWNQILGENETGVKAVEHCSHDVLIWYGPGTKHSHQVKEWVFVFEPKVIQE